MTISNNSNNCYMLQIYVEGKEDVVKQSLYNVHPHRDILPWHQATRTVVP